MAFLYTMSKELTVNLSSVEQLLLIENDLSITITT